MGDKRLILSRIQGRQIKKQRIESMKKFETKAIDVIESKPLEVATCTDPKIDTTIPT